MSTDDVITAGQRVREDTCGVTPLDRAIGDEHLLIDRQAAHDLSRLLGEIPDLAEDLVDARTRQTRFGAVDYRTRSGSKGATSALQSCCRDGGRPPASGARLVGATGLRAALARLRRAGEHCGDG